MRKLDLKRFVPSRFFWFSLALSFVVSGVCIFSLSFHFGSFSERLFTQTTRALSSFLTIDPKTGEVTNFSQLIELRKAMVGTQFEIWLVDRDGKVLQGSAEPSRFSMPERFALPTGDRLTQSSHVTFGQTISAVRLPTREPLWVVTTLGGAAPGVFRQLLLIVGAMIIIASSAASYLLLRIVFRWKSRQAQRVIAEISSGNLQARLPEGERESDELTRSFNHMAAEIENAFTKLQISEASRKQLVGELSHDLRTPVTAVRIALDSLKDGMRGNPQLAHLSLVEVARKELSYIQRLLEYLFFLAKSGEVFLPIKLETFDLNEILLPEIQNRSALGIVDGKRLQWSLDSKLPEASVKADRALTVRLLRNLLDNAQKHGQSTVRASLSEESGEYLFSLLNDGIPIGSRVYPQRGSAALESMPVEVAAKPETSLGIGSTIIEAIAKLHNWELSIEPQIDGTCVFLRIPKA